MLAAHFTAASAHLCRHLALLLNRCLDRQLDKPAAFLAALHELLPTSNWRQFKGRDG
jgi:hypothetical protein